MRIPYLTPLFFVATLVSPSAVRAEHTRVTNPSALSAELFGRGMLYSVQFDRVATDDLVAGAGIGSVSLKTPGGADTNSTVTLIPIYMNYYFTRDGNSPYFTAGATMVANVDAARRLKSSVGNVEFSTNAIQPTAGVGFESRGDSGFLFRVSGYAIFAENIAPWVGFTFGYAF